MPGGGSPAAYPAGREPDLPPGQARHWLQAFAAVSPELIEEPVPFALLRDLADSPIPLALDELRLG